MTSYLRIGNTAIPYSLNNNILSVGNNAYTLNLNNMVLLNMYVDNIDKTKNRLDIVLDLIDTTTMRQIKHAIPVGCYMGYFIINNKRINWV